MSPFLKYFRYVLPLWGVGLLTNWWPEHQLICRVRGWLARPFIKGCGKGFELGSHVTLLSTEKLEIGEKVYIARGCWLNCFGGLKIEDEVMLAPYVIVSTTQYQYMEQSFRNAEALQLPVLIGRGSWLGAHVNVKGGVKIGPRNLIGGNACVVKDTPADALVGGVPAQVIRVRDVCST